MKGDFIKNGVLLYLLIPFLAFNAYGFQGRGFVENKGQLKGNKGSFLFYGSSGDADIFLGRDGYTLHFKKETSTGEGFEKARIDIKFQNCNTQALIEGENSLPARYNFYYGHCPSGITNIVSYSVVRYKEIYPNIDWVIFIDESGGIKYEFHIRPGGNPESIQMKLFGQDSASLLSSGRLRLSFGPGDYEEEKPFSFQMVDGKKAEVPSHFQLEGNNLSFGLGGYDKSRELIVDPYLSWSTYFGGVTSSDYLHDILHEPNGDMWMGGNTASDDLPITPGAYQDTIMGFRDILITKFSASRQLLICTYIGGIGDDVTYDIGRDSQGFIWVGGHCHGANFPVTPDAFQPVFGGKMDMTLSKFNQAGQLIYSTNYGGTNEEEIWDLDIDSQDRIWVVGYTWGDFPTTPNAIQSIFGGGSDDAVVACFSNAGQLEFASYLGGDERDIGLGLTIDPFDNVWVTGETRSEGFPVTSDAIQDSLNFDKDMFITKINSQGTLLYSTFLGGDGSDVGVKLVSDSNGKIWLAGDTRSTDFPTLNPMISNVHAYGDIAICRFDNSGQMEFGTYFGDDNTELTKDLFIKNDNEFWLSVKVTGYSNLPAMNNPIQSSLIGNKNGYYASFDGDGKQTYGSFFGSGFDQVFGISVGPIGNVIVLGSTNRKCLNTPGYVSFDPGNGAYFQPSLLGLNDAFIIEDNPTPVPGTGNMCYDCNQIAAFNLIDSLNCIGDETIIHNMTVGSIDFEWFANGNLVDQLTDTTILVPGTGTFEISMVSNSGYCLDTITAIDSVLITALPAFSLRNDTSLCPGDTVELFAPNSYAFMWGDSTYDIVQSATEGIWSIVVWDSVGCQTMDTVGIDYFLNELDLGGDTSFCEGGFLLLESGSQYVNHQWSTGDTTSTITLDSSSQVFLSVIDYHGCKWEDSLELIVGSFYLDLATDTILCFGNSIEVSLPTNLASWEWMDGDTSSINRDFTEGEIFVVAYDMSGCEGSDTFFIQISNPFVDLGIDSIYCHTASITLDAFEEGLVSYEWSSGSGLPFLEVYGSGIYSVSVVDSFNCSAFDEVEVFLSNSEVDLGPDTMICDNTPISLSPDVDFENILWNSGSISDSIFTDDPGLYFVTIWDSLGCSSEDSIKISVVPQQFPLIEIDGSNLIVSGEGDFQWYLNEDKIIGAVYDYFPPQDTGTYMVILTDSAGCEWESNLYYVPIIISIEEGITGAFSVFPNPFKDEVFVFVPNDFGGLVEYHVYNSIGQKVAEGNYSTDRDEAPYSIKLDGLGKGIYYLKLRSPVEDVFIKLLKEN